MFNQIGIYKIESKTGAVYIGQTRDWNKRVQRYKSLNCKQQSRLFNSLAKYGWFHHDFEIIHEFSDNVSQETLDNYEKLYIEQYKCNYLKYPELNGLNLTNGGREFSKETYSEKAIKSRSNTMKGVPKSEEHKRKISETLKGRKLSEEHKENLRKNRLDVLARINN
jgi:group I intron endonuclease